MKSSECGVECSIQAGSHMAVMVSASESAPAVAYQESAPQTLATITGSTEGWKTRMMHGDSGRMASSATSGPLGGLTAF